MTLLFVCLLLAASASSSQSPPPIETASYDAYMQLPFDARIRTFNAISPENRASLVREQIVRWRKKHSDRLDAAQHQFLAEAVTLITADRYDMANPRRMQLLDEMKVFEARVGTLFTPEEARQAFTIHGDYIPER